MLRQELVELEEPAWYDTFVRGLKTRLLRGELGGERREMWDLVRREGLGLVGGSGQEEEKAVSFFFLFFIFPLPNELY